MGLLSHGVSRRLALTGVAALIASLVVACSDLLTSAPDAADVFDGPVEGLSASELAQFIRGDEEFGRRFAPATGLGPIFNDVSCASCHSGDGRGRPGNALTRIGSPDNDMYRSLGGPQIQDRAIPGAIAEAAPPAGVPISLRLPPPVFGAGLIEAIPEAEILSRADPNDGNGDGISGRPNWVLPPAWVPAAEPGSGYDLRIGRFGRKAQTSSILQQTVDAYLQDMGITTDFLPDENLHPIGHPYDAADVVPDPEVPAGTVFAVVNYLRMLAPPAPGAPNAVRDRGSAVFTDIGCAQCHVPVLTTGPATIGALANKPVALYSDLLLHDMGEALADQRPDGGANGREWRTTPLWGMRLIRQFLNGDAFLMHDGRARTIEEAILLHGGEAQRARDLFNALTAADRSALVDFVGSR